MRKFTLSLFGLLVTSLATPVWQAMAQEPVTFVRRAEAVMILLKNAGVTIDENAHTDGAYPDILDGEWYVPYVVKGLELDMIEVEYATGLIYPYRSVTRAQFMKMMTKAFGLTADIPYQYTDIPSDAWYTSYVGLAWRYKLFGNTDKFYPNRRMTHAEATQAIYTLLTAEPALQPHPNMFPVAAPPPEEKVGLLHTLIDALRPRTTTVEPTAPAKPVQRTASPQLVKSTVLKLIHSRGNRADYTKNELVEAVNEVRARYNLDPVRSNYHLDLAAQRHAKDMAERGYFSHYTPEGLSYVDRIKGANYLEIGCDCEPGFSMGENLAKGQLSVEQVMEDWLNSPNHRKNILRPQFDEMGIGLFGDLWVQTFGHVDVP